MSDPAVTQPALTDLAIVREIERIATKVQHTQITDLEIALLMAHMPNLLREYCLLRAGPPPAKPASFDIALPENAPAQPRLHLVGSEEAQP